MKRILTLAAAAALVCTAAQAQTPLKIGFLGVLSGPQAAVGQDQLDGLMLLVEKNGGKLGGVPVSIIK
jgi:branched-chain amino acid transport system substrate-binding protein